MHRISIQELALLLGFNLFTALVFCSRWWLALQAYGYRIPYLSAFRYRIAAFSVSYFTPGSQFGGEPLQVYALEKLHQVPRSTAIASVTIDKLFEILTNFSFLALGLALTIQYSLLPYSTRNMALLWAALMIVIPLGYLISLKFTHRPISALLDVLPARLKKKGWTRRVNAFAAETEDLLVALINRRPYVTLTLLLSSILISACSLLEYGLALRILGVPLNFQQTIIVLTAARIAFLTPLPGGLGALEAGQILALQTLGFDPALGIAVSLWIRARDLGLGALGFFWSAQIIQSDSNYTLSAEVGD